MLRKHDYHVLQYIALANFGFYPNHRHAFLKYANSGMPTQGPCNYWALPYVKQACYACKAQDYCLAGAA